MARTKFQGGPITIRLEPMEMIQLKNICAIRRAPSIEGLCLGFIRDGMLQETQGILAHFAKVAERDQETDPPTFRKARDANHLTDEETDEFLENLKVEKHDQEIFRDTSKGRLRTSMQPILGDRSGTSTGRISSYQGNISEHAPATTQADFSADLIKFDPPELRFIQLNPLPPELDEKGLRGGEADEESLQKPRHVSLPDEYATCPHGTRNADLDSPHEPTSKDITAAEYIRWTDKQDTLGTNMQSAYLERSTVPSSSKGHEVDQYAPPTYPNDHLKGKDDEA